MSSAQRAEASGAGLRADPDIQAELSNLALGAVSAPPPGHPAVTAGAARCPFAPSNLPAPPLTMGGGSYLISDGSAGLLKEVGGAAKIHEMTALFYPKAFANKHLDQFIRSYDDPHSMRLGNWIVEKMGGAGTPWSKERQTRNAQPVEVAEGHRMVVHDRSSAHHAAWMSPKRAPEAVGDHFQLDDARVWMRLMFWSAREAGLFQHPRFEEWYVRFIGHFVRVYERTAPTFARDSARWSADQGNIDRYIAAGNVMEDVEGVHPHAALRQLPERERGDSSWPYRG
mmetsp:Transcript_42796/g.101839  ORF Transcript_42796/g.101839 Transcript_42796/m.101839 type:complete len:284 (+) Transcript_42796:299-1150(+)